MGFSEVIFTCSVDVIFVIPECLTLCKDSSSEILCTRNTKLEAVTVPASQSRQTLSEERIRHRCHKIQFS